MGAKKLKEEKGDSEIFSTTKVGGGGRGGLLKN